MMIRCPYPLGRDHDTSDNCGEPIHIRLSARVREGMYAPPEPPEIIDLSGDCPHVAAINHGDLDDRRLYDALDDADYDDGGEG